MTPAPAKLGVRGFTLVELLVVVAIIALLAAIAIPAVTGAINSAKRAKCMGNLRTIYTYLQAYAQEHNGQMPVPAANTGGSPYKAAQPNFTQALTPYIQKVADRKVFYCPAHKKADGSLYVYTDLHWNTEGSISYLYYGLTNNNIGIPLRLTDNNIQLLMSDKFNQDADNPTFVDANNHTRICSHPDGLNLLRLNGSIEFSKYGVDIRTW